MWMGSMQDLAAMAVLVLVSWTPTSDAELSDHDWGYYTIGLPDDHKPERWNEYFEMCGGESQSPIHIYSNEVVYRPDFGQLVFQDYDEPLDTKFVMVNNGHTLQFDLQGNVTGHIAGGGLPDRYKLIQFHVHWGSGDNNGSEHWVDDRHYAAELHLVHIREQYASIAEAVKDPQGMAILGVIVKIGEEENGNMYDIVSHLPQVAYTDDTPHTLLPFKLFHLLPADRSSFYRYNGSLTTPPCTEAAVWTVFSQPITFSKGQIFAFRNTLHHSDRAHREVAGDYKLHDNHRLPQPLHGRQVFTNQMSGATVTGSRHAGILALLSITALLV